MELELLIHPIQIHFRSNYVDEDEGIRNEKKKNISLIERQLVMLKVGR